ncbi:GIY-YIG nuclease family protein [Anaerococcus vaginimassiliensis]|uniref:GIY-YIG nuclease family protein n=1 Tax=Anaerococcus vaginimassiliensis TaxID=2042308 RepID=UPI0010320B5B|nr:GIY-YIG nuclease family protein [Anaerococcus vaginimassiliensis]
MKKYKYEILNPYGVVYLITNTINNKKYIGITTRNISDRFKEHCKANSYIGRAIRKYGENNFSIEVLDIAHSKEELFDLEVKYISNYNSYRDGYNQTIGGDGASLVEDLELKLTNKQKNFCNLVDKENKKAIDVSNREDMIRCVIFNSAWLYLNSVKARDKINAAKLMLKLNPNFTLPLYKYGVINFDEVIHYSNQKISSFERWEYNGKQTG